jgi:hypothetical protein
VTVSKQAAIFVSLESSLVECISHSPLCVHHSVCFILPSVRKHKWMLCIQLYKSIQLQYALVSICTGMLMFKWFIFYITDVI